MKIRDLILSLEKRAELSDKGLDCEVSLSIQAIEYTASAAWTVDAKIDDVSNLWGENVDEVKIDVILSEDDIDKLQGFKEELKDLIS